MTEYLPFLAVFLGLGTVVAYGLYRRNLHNAVPVAREYLIEKMKSPMVVLDDNFQTLDSNPAYDKLKEAAGPSLLEARLRQVLSGAWGEEQTGVARHAGIFQVNSDLAGAARYYAIEATRLKPVKGHAVNLVIFQDITVQKRYENEMRLKTVQLSAKNQELQYANLELERLRALALDANPSTGLPGNNSINEAIDNALKTQSDVCVIYTDLDNFKAFNDKYGFGLGDKIIRFNADVLVLAARDVCGPEAFIGHVGGDDFVLIVPSGCAAKFGDEVIRRFDLGIRDFYCLQDLEAGGISSVNRKGQDEWFPIIAISMAGVDLKDRKFNHYLEVANLCAELKKKSKAVSGSSFFMERRQNGLACLLPNASATPPHP